MAVSGQVRRFASLQPVSLDIGDVFASSVLQVSWLSSSALDFGISGAEFGPIGQPGPDLWCRLGLGDMRGLDGGWAYSA